MHKITVMKKTILSLFAMVLIGLAPATAQRYAVIDTKYILDKMPEYKEAQKKLDQSSEQWQKEIEARQVELDGLYRNFEAEKVMLSETLRTKREDELFNKEKELRDLQKKRFGFEGDIPDVPSISLGVADASLLETISLYGTIANGGLRPEWHYIERIEDAEGRVVYDRSDERQPEPESVLSTEEALYLRYALEMAVDSGTGRSLRSYVPEGALAGKTGTTQDQADGWFAGFGPGLVAAVRVGAENPAVHFKSLSSGAGSRTALPIFGRFWRKVRAESSVSAYVTQPFDSIPEEVLAGFRCPSYLPEMPVVAEDDGGFFDGLFQDDEPEPTAPRPEAPPQQQPRERPAQPGPEQRPSNSFRAWLERTFRR